MKETEKERYGKSRGEEWETKRKINEIKKDLKENRITDVKKTQYLKPRLIWHKAIIREYPETIEFISIIIECNGMHLANII